MAHAVDEPNTITLPAGLSEADVPLAFAILAFSRGMITMKTAMKVCGLNREEFDAALRSDFGKKLRAGTPISARKAASFGEMLKAIGGAIPGIEEPEDLPIDPDPWAE